MEERPTDETQGITRRRALAQLGAAGLTATALGGGLDGLLAQAAQATSRTAKTGSMKDIEHVIIFMQENRSFDHYFGTLSGVRGFSDKRGRAAFTQKDATGNVYTPWHLPKACLPDLTHDWGPQHMSWNGGHMDGFVKAHEAVDPTGVGPETMGHYDGSDVPLYFALADAFTICDGYHCSVIGPTDPNRLMSMSGTIDPDGAKGGPLVKTNIVGRNGGFSWTTMPEQLEARDISWKVYSDAKTGFFDNVLTYFDNYGAGTPGEATNPLAKKAFDPTFPGDFNADVAAGRLPKVSWLLASIEDTDHPGYSAAFAGEEVLRQVLETLFSHPDVWSKTALFVTWDENGGFFDHVAPPVAPAGTKGEYITVPNINAVPNSAGIRGPIGLGFRVPLLVISPFSRGGLVCSDVFDHTSTLRFLEARFGAEVPNLSAWRRKTTGDLTSAFNFAAQPEARAVSLKKISGSTISPCPAPAAVPYVASPMPKQAKGTRRRPSGIVKKR